LSEEITKAGVIDYVASYRFTNENGACLGFHLCGIFANSGELPAEIVNAKMIEDLTPEQRAVFVTTANVKVR